MMSEMKKRLQRKGARKGFTLVELLIVIIIIGILAGAMMLVAGTSRDSAEASRIISDLRNMKAAALMWMAENPMGYSNDNWEDFQGDPSPLNKYLDRALDKNTMRFKFEVGTIVQSWDEDKPVGETVWLLGYDLAKGDKYEEVRSGVKKNLENQAESAGLYGDKNIDFTEDPKGVGFYTADKNIVYVIVQ